MLQAKTNHWKHGLRMLCSVCFQIHETVPHLWQTSFVVKSELLYLRKTKGFHRLHLI
nr:hypothetical protein Iba_chr09aCG13890 [Ipomoea batatas]GME14032.1 hypothetical protein Iba_scaffold14897CG0710 [Ipomoea batatas]